MDELDVIRNFDLAMYNSYYFITKERGLEDMIVDNKVFFAHDIDHPPTTKDLEELIKFFEQKDDFEKCIKLNKLKEDGNSN
jgi:hypothetical protein